MAVRLIAKDSFPHFAVASWASRAEAHEAVTGRLPARGDGKRFVPPRQGVGRSGKRQRTALGTGVAPFPAIWPASPRNRIQPQTRLANARNFPKDFERSRCHSFACRRPARAGAPIWEIALVAALPRGNARGSRSRGRPLASTSRARLPLTRNTVRPPLWSETEARP
jgi:hypothetical protein